MGSPPERRREPGRRRPDVCDAVAVRGLLHDLGHEMTTLSYLIEAVRGDVSLPDDSSYRLELLSMEMSRLLEIIQRGLKGMEDLQETEPVEVRAMSAQLARLSELAHEAEVVVEPGPDVTAQVNPVLLWRVLSNLIDNAARAAGAGGRVVVSVWRRDAVVIEVADNGPGFGEGPAGAASLGLDIVTSLLASCDGSLEVESPPDGGTVVRVLLPGRATAVAASMPQDRDG